MKLQSRYVCRLGNVIGASAQRAASGCDFNHGWILPFRWGNMGLHLTWHNHYRPVFMYIYIFKLSLWSTRPIPLRGAQTPPPPPKKNTLKGEVHHFWLAFKQPLAAASLRRRSCITKTLLQSWVVAWRASLRLRPAARAPFAPALGREREKAVHRCIQLTPALMVHRLYLRHGLTSPICIFYRRASSATCTAAAPIWVDPEPPSSSPSVDLE